jgi:hypothetical protein
MTARPGAAPGGAIGIGRPAVLLVVLVVVAGLVVWLPPALVARHVAAAVRPHLAAGGTVTVAVRATPWGLAAGRLDRVAVAATDVGLGALVAQRMTARLESVHLARTDGGWSVARVAAGETVLEVGPQALQRLLASRGVERARVDVLPEAVVATGEIRLGAALLPLQVRAQPYSATGRDLRFRILAFDVGGTQVPPVLAETLAAALQPPIVLDGLPWPLAVTRVDLAPGVIRLVARVGDVP